MMKFDKNLVGGSSELMLLRLLHEKDYYGYEIIKELRRRSENSFDFKEGTLYPILHKMESKGLITSYDQMSDAGRKRTYYKITNEGGEQLDRQLRQWQEFSRSVNLVIGGEPTLA